MTACIVNFFVALIIVLSVIGASYLIAGGKSQ